MPAQLRRLLQVVADYRRLSAALTAGYAGQGRASRPQYPGVAEDCCCAGVTIRPRGPILTMDRRPSAVLAAFSQLASHRESRSYGASMGSTPATPATAPAAGSGGCCTTRPDGTCSPRSAGWPGSTSRSSTPGFDGRPSGRRSRRAPHRPMSFQLARMRAGASPAMLRPCCGA
jgi:hypothetical protein